MKDEFLYRLRAEPPADFALALKGRLDRVGRARARVTRFGIGFVLVGTAFAFVVPGVRNVVGWFGGDAAVVGPAPTAGPAAGATSPPSDSAPPLTSGSSAAGAAIDAAAARASSAASATSDAAAANSSAPTADSAELRWTPTEQAAAGAPSAESTGEASSSESAAERSGTSPPRETSGYITTGPLLAEEGTAARAFENRRALFTVMSWALEPITSLLQDKRRFDTEAAALGARRIEHLAPLIDEAFTFDTRGKIQSRSRDEIWQQRTEFSRHAVELTETSKALQSALRSNDRLRILRAAAAVHEACGSCHEAFRKDGNKNVGTKWP